MADAGHAAQQLGVGNPTHPSAAQPPAATAGVSGSLARDTAVRSMAWALAHSTLNTVFYSLTFGGSIFVLFLDYLGLPKARIGLVLSLLPLCGLLALVAGPATVRFGLKRTFVIFYGLRKPVMLLLLLAPWMISRFGAGAGGWYVIGVMFVFAVLRAIAETGYYPWYRQFIPDSFRGRFSAIANLATVSSGALTIWLASYVLAASRGAAGYMKLITAGVIFGIVSVAMMIPVPGGGPAAGPPSLAHYLRGIRNCLRDRRFVWYLLGVGCYVMGLAIVPFMPLYLRDFVGLGQATVVRLEPAAMLAGIVSSFLAGWAADRYGGRPVTLVGVAGTLVLPVFWVLIPRHSPASLPLAYAGACWQGLCSATVGISTTRLLFSELMPPAKSMDYSAVNYAATGLFGGIGPLVVGSALTGLKGWSTRLAGLTLDQYAPLLAAGFVLVATSGYCFGRTHRDADKPTAEVRA